MNNSIFDIRSSVPYADFIYVDANVYIKIFEGKGAEYEQFLIDAVQNGAITIYSSVVLAEVKRWVQRDVYKQYARAMGVNSQGRKAPWKVLEDTGDPIVGQAAVNAWNQAQSLIQTPSSVEAYMPSTQKLDEGSNYVMAKYGLGVGDAEHIVVMNYNQTNAMLTDDGGFNVVPNLNIYSKSGTVLSNGTSSSNTLLPFKPLI